MKKTELKIEAKMSDFTELIRSKPKYKKIQCYSEYGYFNKLSNYVSSKEYEKTNLYGSLLINGIFFVDVDELLTLLAVGDIFEICEVRPDNSGSSNYGWVSDNIYKVLSISEKKIIIEKYDTVFKAFKNKTDSEPESTTIKLKKSAKLNKWIIFNKIIQERHPNEEYKGGKVFIDDGSDIDYNYKIGRKKYTLNKADIREISINEILNKLQIIQFTYTTCIVFNVNRQYKYTYMFLCVSSLQNRNR